MTPPRMSVSVSYWDREVVGEGAKRCGLRQGRDWQDARIIVARMFADFACRTYADWEASREGSVREGGQVQPVLGGYSQCEKFSRVRPGFPISCCFLLLLSRDSPLL
jgi:hypothetical protein